MISLEDSSVSSSAFIDEDDDISKELCVGLTNSVEDSDPSYVAEDKALSVGLANSVEDSDPSYVAENKALSVGLANSVEDSDP